jgi:hypothetical protein
VLGLLVLAFYTNSLSKASAYYSSIIALVSKLVAINNFSLSHSLRFSNLLGVLESS